jgi:hypothetical protein
MSVLPLSVCEHIVRWGSGRPAGPKVTVDGKTRLKALAQGRNIPSETVGDALGSDLVGTHYPGAAAWLIDECDDESAVG